LPRFLSPHSPNIVFVRLASRPPSFELSYCRADGAEGLHDSIDSCGYQTPAGRPSEKENEHNKNERMRRQKQNQPYSFSFFSPPPFFRPSLFLLSSFPLRTLVVMGRRVVLCA